MNADYGDVPMGHEAEHNGWRVISCGEREDLIDARGRSYNGFSDDSGIGVSSSLTDHEGQYGKPTIYTEWYERDTDTPVLRDYLYPQPHESDPIMRRGRCVHFVPMEQS